MRLYVFLAFLIVCILAVNAAQQNQSNRRTQLAKRKSTNGAVAVNSNHLKAKPRARSASPKKVKKVRKVKPALKRRPTKKTVRRVVKKSNRRSGAPAKKIARKSSGNRNSIRRGSRGGSRKRLAKQELSDSSENKSIGAGQANGGDLDTQSGEKPQDATNNQAASKPVSTGSAPSQPASVPVASQPASVPASTGSASPSTSLLSSQGQGNPLSSSPFNIPKSNGQNQAIGAAFSQSSNGGSAFAAGFASIGKANTAGGVGQVSGKQANPNSENLNTAEDPASSDTSSSDTGAEEGSGELAAFRRRPRQG